MRSFFMTSKTNIITLLCLFSVLPLLCGCYSILGKDDSSTNQLGKSEETPPHQAEFKDILVPGELSYDREDSLFTNTSSFAGGILSYSGRVQPDSVADYFLNTMPDNGWKLAGSVKSKSILLAFTKANKVCMIKIFDTALGQKTAVSIYVTHDVTGGQPSSGFIEEPVKGAPAPKY